MTTPIKFNGNRQTLKLFLIIFATLALIVGGLLFYIYTVETGNELLEIETDEIHSVKFRSATVSAKFQGIVSDLMFIAPHHELINYIDSGSEDARKHFELGLTELSRSNKIYDQIRFIDLEGMEKIRINFNDGYPSAVPIENLQNKSDRYYFKETTVLNKSEVYVSPMDLNVEGDKIDIPYMPMIRFGTPVYDSKGIKKGIVILNYLADIMLNDFNDPLIRTNGTSMLLNADGFWLLSDNPVNQWGFMFGNDRTFKKACPQEWAAIDSSISGQFSNNRGLFTYTTIYPLREVVDPHTASFDTILSPQRQLALDTYTWKAISFVSASIIASRMERERLTLINVYIVLLIILAIISWWLAQMTVQRRQAFDGLHRALDAKDMLMREINHRAKNNLNVIQSLLMLQSERIKDEASKGAIKDIQNRITSMGLIHDRLSRSADSAFIETGEYVNALINNIVASYTNIEAQLNLEVCIDDMRLDIEQAMALGLIINELVTNALKHAFNGVSDPSLQVTLQHASPCVLGVRDNGNGIPDGFDPATSESLGMGIIESLALQLMGEFEFKADGGTVFRMEFDCTGENQ